jgi:hypothetical protein
MSYVDLDKMTPEDVILHFVLECRGAGHFLPYQDYQIIEEWIVAASGDADELLVVLSDVLPPYFAPPAPKSKGAERQGADDATRPRRAKSLSGAKKLVLSRLRDRAMRLAAGARRPEEETP